VLGTPPLQPAASESRAVELTRANHLLEARQAELARELRTGASERTIAELRLEVALLERRYAAAIRAMASAP
jgi:hypothetical protein